MVLKAFFGVESGTCMVWEQEAECAVCPLALSMHSLPARSAYFWRHVP